MTRKIVGVELDGDPLRAQLRQVARRGQRRTRRQGDERRLFAASKEEHRLRLGADRAVRARYEPRGRQRVGVAEAPPSSRCPSGTRRSRSPSPRRGWRTPCWVGPRQGRERSKRSRRPRRPGGRASSVLYPPSRRSSTSRSDASPPCRRVWCTRSPRKVVAVRKEPRVDGHAAGLRVRVDAGHPGADAVRVEDVVPGRVERVRGVDTPPVPAYLHHLGRTRQSQLGGGRVRGAIDDPAEAHRPRLPGVVRVAYVVLLELPGAPARHVEPAVVDGQVDVAHERRDRAEGLKRGWELGGVGGLGRDGDGLLRRPAVVRPGARARSRRRDPRR